MILKAAEALNKAKGIFDEVKKIAPDLHKHYQGGKCGQKSRYQSYRFGHRSFC